MISLWALSSKSATLIFQKSWKFLGKLEQVNGIYYFICCTNLVIQMKMISRFCTPFVKCLRINLISQWKTQNGINQ